MCTINFLGVLLHTWEQRGKTGSWTRAGGVSRLCGRGSGKGVCTGFRGGQLAWPREGAEGRFLKEGAHGG